uniref:Eukaryotic translation initiation factor 4 gamma 1-like n=1 Tax=Gadus morhua TaxID=8049 RepID=A0A8C5AHN1_GADMO
MNKPPQPITGPVSVPHPAPSPGLTQAGYAPGQPPSLVFANPQLPQMNPAPQPRQPYYPNRPTMPTSAPRVQTSSGPRPVGPTHVYPAGSQMMMIPQQQISFPGSPQGYFIPPGQYRPQYMAPTQQYPVTAGTAGFFPGTSPAEYPGFAGAYYPAQPQFTQSVQPAPVIISPAQQPQQAPPPQQPPAQPQGPPKRERIPIRIRDPNQGGKDITEEIMSGGRATSTPTPPQVGVDTYTGGHYRTESAGSVETPPPASASPVPEVPLETVTPELVPAEPLTKPAVAAAVEAPPPLIEEQKQQPPAPAVLPPPSPPPAAEPEPEAEVSDTVDAPVPPPAASAAKRRGAGPVAPPAAERTPEKEEEKKPEVAKKSEPEKSTVAKLKKEPAAGPPAPVTPSSATGDEAASVPPVKAASAPTVKASSAPPVKASSAPPVKASSAPPVKASSAPPVKASSAPPVKASSAPPVKASSAPPVKAAVVPPVKAAVVPPPVKAAVVVPPVEAAVVVPPVKAAAVVPPVEAAVVPPVEAAVPPPEQAASPVPEPSPVQAEPAVAAPAAAEKPASEAVDETWEEKEDKQNPKPVVPKTEPAEQKYQYKEENWKPINPEDKKQYDRDFLLGCQFITASMHKPEGLPLINEVILDKANATPMRPADPARVMNVGPDFTPSYLGNLGSRQSTGGPGPGPRGPQGQRKEPRKIIITSMSLNNEVQLNKAEKAWKPGVKKAVGGRGAEEGAEEDDPEEVKTQELFKRVRSVLNKLTPQMFQALMKQVTDMSIDTEARLKGVIDLIFEKAISEPNFSVAYANMCRCLMGLKVPTTDNPEATVNFRKLLLNRCQKEFEKDQDDDVIFEKKQKELEASKDDEERDRLKVELQASKDKARRRSLGNIKFIGELFKLKMLTEAIMHDCVVKLLKNHDEESLECLCRLLATIGKDLDFEKAKPRMEQYFAQLDKIIKERKTSSRIRFMLLDVIDLRRWVPRRGEQGPKTIEQIHKDAEAEEHREQIKVQQQMLSKKDGGGGGGGGGHHAQGGGRGSQVQDEGWNTVPISKGNRPIDTTRFSKIINKDVDDQRLAPGGRGFGNWTKGSSGGTGSKAPGSGRPATSTVNRFSALQQSGPPSGDSSSASSSSRDRGGERDRNDRGFDRFERREGRDGGGRPTITKRSFSRESQERGGDGGRGPTEPVRRVSSMTDDRVRRDRAASKEPAVKPGRDATPPPAAASKPALSEEEMDKKSNAIIEEYIHINDLKEALQCVSEMNSASLLFVFVRNGVESTLERSPGARAHLGHLMHQLIKAGTLPPAQYYKGLQETLEMAEDMAIDVPHIWLYLAEQIVPMLQEGGIPMEQLFREISKPLVPLGMAGVLLAQILTLLCKGMTHKKVGAMWNEAGLNWSEFLSKDVDVNKFVTEQHLEFTLDTEGSEGPEKKPLTNEEISKQLERLIQDKAENQRIIDWVEANLDAQQSTGNSFVRALMTSVCQSAIICDNLYKVDGKQISERGSLLLKYLSDEPKELQALYALQALMVHMEQPANLLRMFFDNLYDEDVIKEETFYKWESSKDPAEQTGKGVALKSVTTFFTWLREAEEESDKE